MNNASKHPIVNTDPDPDPDLIVTDPGTDPNNSDGSTAASRLPR
ncbi:MAG: hypothetical protein Q9M22_02930 [Mariprofundaceae bacterium]|nr:hypothetical protein [Mariprofundaceae bacterium]